MYIKCFSKNTAVKQLGPLLKLFKGFKVDVVAVITAKSQERTSGPTSIYIYSYIIYIIITKLYKQWYIPLITICKR